MIGARKSQGRRRLCLAAVAVRLPSEHLMEPLLLRRILRISMALNLPITTAILRRSHNAKMHALNNEFSVYTESWHRVHLIDRSIDRHHLVILPCAQSMTVYRFGLNACAVRCGVHLVYSHTHSLALTCMQK